MKTMSTIFKVFLLALFVGVVVSSCSKDDPYANYTPAREATLIQEWLTTMTKNNKDVDTTSTGIYYIMDKAGTGETVKSGNTVTVKYTGMFVDGVVFDDSSLHGNGTMTYVHKTDRLIQGWEEGIEVMSKGSKAVFLIPSSKGYGATGYSTIPPYSPLLFIIEVIDIK